MTALLTLLNWIDLGGSALPGRALLCRTSKELSPGSTEFGSQAPIEIAKRVPVAVVEKVLGLYREKYFDLNVRQFHEKLQEEHQVAISYSWVKGNGQICGMLTGIKLRSFFDGFLNGRTQCVFPSISIGISDTPWNVWSGGFCKQRLVMYLTTYENRRCWISEILDQIPILLALIACLRKPAARDTSEPNFASCMQNCDARRWQ
jgi:hypothetical protein